MLGYFGHMWELYAMWTWIAAFAGGVAGRRRRDGRIGRRVRRDRERRRSDASWRGFWADRWGKARVAGAAMLASAACALASPLFYGAPLAALLVLAVVWGFTVVADSAQFSALVAEHTPRTHVGTALTLQTSAGFLLTMVSMQAGAADHRARAAGNGPSCFWFQARCSERSR